MEKKLIQHIVDLLLFASFPIAIVAVFTIEKQLVSMTIYENHFWFYGSMGFVSVATLVYSALYKSSLRFSLTDEFVFFFIGSVSLTAFVFNDAAANTTKLVVLASIISIPKPSMTAIHFFRLHQHYPYLRKVKIEL